MEPSRELEVKPPGSSESLPADHGKHLGAHFSNRRRRLAGGCRPPDVTRANGRLRRSA
ncbi:hypothetical protein CCMA1212_009173 [Trichoderma ghanense]|uniref:Uncharacterized protein n=1 Tax=Trichoderma ghanense TaxID=65468 RepID=A0ABY2GU16_9HYPO